MGRPASDRARGHSRACESCGETGQMTFHQALAYRSALGALAFHEPPGCGFGPPRVFRAVAICSTQGLDECPDLRREKAPVRVNGVQPNVWKDLPIQKNGFDPACIDIGTDQETRSGTHTHTL